MFQSFSLKNLPPVSGRFRFSDFWEKAKQKNTQGQRPIFKKSTDFWASTAYVCF
jgi:hypothetical protein